MNESRKQSEPEIPPAADPPAENRRLSWSGRVGLAVFLALAIAVVFYTNTWLTERYTASTKSRAEVRQVLYAGNILSELQRNAIVPLLLSRDPDLVASLQGQDYSLTTQRLISYVDEIGAASIMLLDETGRVVGATDRNLLSTNFRNAPYYIEAVRSNETVFTNFQNDSGAYVFAYSRRMLVEGQLRGVIVVSVDLRKFESSWKGISDAVFVANSEGTIMLATEPRWRGQVEDLALKDTSAPSAIERAIRVTADFAVAPTETYVLGQAVIRTESRISFHGWKLVTFTPYASVRERVNGVLALEIMGFAILLAGGFYFTSRRAWTRSALFERESAELRLLNTALQREIAERERAEKHLEVAEQTLAQSSKLAALGEMSAAVSHELNQPLAAMKTYLAGARLLLQRKRPEEALSSFQRIDDLIERMGAITRQLKSYARKGGEAFAPVDLRAAVSSALAMMEPQLKSRKVKVQRTLPRSPVMVLGDRIRIEQVIINLFRNALDATREVEDPVIAIVLTAGETAVLTLRDNGHGIKDLDNLFEPFYTTKAPGDGVGLGLAISSSIVNDHGGRLTAHNGAQSGAVFELQLPVLSRESEAAE
jgi:two-component system C4-dicarboxylate transport sensor histidine kinase DctB